MSMGPTIGGAVGQGSKPQASALGWKTEGQNAKNMKKVGKRKSSRSKEREGLPAPMQSIEMSQTMPSLVYWNLKRWHVV